MKTQKMGKIDLLNRKVFVSDVVTVINQLSEIKKGCCFSIEGRWGTGKTFVLEEVEESLRDLGRKKFFVAHYNCWQNDYYEEPAIAIISEIMGAVQKESTGMSEKSENIIVTAGATIAKELERLEDSLEHIPVVKVASLILKIVEGTQEREKDKYKFDTLYNFSKVMENVRVGLKMIAEKETIVFVVDELDRCIPEYAIKVLERLHHIFYGLDNIVLILAIDRVQLEYSVEKMFGAGTEKIDVELYLKKFIDFSMQLDSGNLNRSFIDKYKFYFDRFTEAEKSRDMVNLCSMLSLLLQDMNIRNQEKLFEKMNIVHSVVCNKQADFSVMAFEVLYEVLHIWGINDMSIYARLDIEGPEKLEKLIGAKNTRLLQQIGYNMISGTKKNGKRILKCDLYGKMYWYFVCLFNEMNIGLYEPLEQNLADEKEIVRKYCELCRIIK